MRTVFLRRGLVALFAAAVSFGAITQAQAETLRIGYQKYGTLVLLKAKGTLEKRLAAQGVDENTANALAAGTALMSGAGALMPGGYGSTLTARIATGAGAQAALGIANRVRGALDRQLSHTSQDVGGLCQATLCDLHH